MNLKNIILTLILATTARMAFAGETCDSPYWKLQGHIEKDALAYDKFIESLPVDPTAKLNEYIRTHGLLIQLYSNSGDIHGHNDYLQSEGASGLNVGLFLKFMRVTISSNVVFDTIYEVEKPDSKRAIHKWTVPYGAKPPVAVQSYNVIYPETLTGICKEFKRPVYLSVSEEGNYKALPFEDKFPRVTPIPEAKCTAQRLFFHGEKTSACGEFKDLTSGKTRILVWNARIK